jgi:GPH family glycoside/pentoside/hexuronide:cation symporter
MTPPPPPIPVPTAQRAASAAAHGSAAPDRVPASEKLALGLGQAAALGTHNALTTLANPVYNVIMGMSPVHLSVLTFAQRIWDAFLDPLVGQLSDNLRTRWGRRRPLMLIAALPMALGFASLWCFPRGLSSLGLVAYFFGSSLAFYLCHSFFYVPLTALQIEATSDYHERTRVASVVGICTWGFTIFNQWMYPLLQSKWFSDPVSGVRTVGVAAALVYGAMALVPLVWVCERPPVGQAPRRQRQRFGSALRETWGNRDFVLLLGIRAVSQFGYGVVAILGFYLNCYLVHAGDLGAASAIQGWIGTSYVAGSVAAFWLFRVIGLRFGKKRTLQISAALLVAGALIKIAVYHPGWRWAQLLIPMTNGLALSGITLMTTAMLADVVSADELATGCRREGLYVSVLSWFDKVGSSTGALLSGFVLIWTGFDAKLGAHQPFATLAQMKWLYAIMPFAGAAVTVLLAQKYRLDERKAYEIKQALEARAAAAAAEASHANRPANPFI